MLGGLLRTICWLDRAQSRHAEFHADLVAVSAAGSDAPVHLLYKCLFAEQCLHQVLDELDAARDCDLHTSDLFYHLDKAAEFLRRKAKNPRLGLPPELPNDPRQLTEVFKRRPALAARYAVRIR